MEALMFENNSFAVSADTEVYTAFGAKRIVEKTAILARREDMSLTPVTASTRKSKKVTSLPSKMEATCSSMDIQCSCRRQIND